MEGVLRRHTNVMFAGALVSLLFALGQLLVVSRVMSVVAGIYIGVGGTFPRWADLLVGGYRSGILALALILLDAGVFIVAYRLARRDSAWLLFVPAGVYAVGALLFLPVLNVAVSWSIY